MLIFLIGPSASGKGTQAALLSQKYCIPALSMGAILRDEVATNSTIGKLIGQIIDEGNFVTSDVTIEILTKRLQESHVQNGGAIIDGFPRLYEQVTRIQPFIDSLKTTFRVVHYKLSYEDCYKRLQERIEEGQRRDDDSVLRKRYDSYLMDIEKIVEFYNSKKVLIEIDARSSVEEIFKTTCDKLEQSLRNNG